MPSKPKIFLLTTGGTAGHVFPAETLGKALQEKGHEVLFLTDVRGKRFLRLFAQDAKLVLCATPSSTRHPLRLLKAAALLGLGSLQCLYRFIRKRPSAVIGFGGYPSFPALFAATLLRVPIFLQEQNTVVGRVNSFFARFARALFTTTPHVSHLSPDHIRKIAPVGLPIRSHLYACSKIPYTPRAPNQPFHILIFGGSQGAQIFSHIVPDAFKLLPDDLKKCLHVTQQCPLSDLEKVTAKYKAESITHSCAPFFEDIGHYMAQAHLIISRAGATSVHEIALVGRPALFVPLGRAIDNDQLENAKQLSSHGAAFLCQENNFSSSFLAHLLTQCIIEPHLLIEMVQKIKMLQSSEKITFPEEKMIDLIEKELNCL